MNVSVSSFNGISLRRSLSARNSANRLRTLVGGLRTIDADVLLEVAVELIERFQQRFVLLAHTEVG